MLAVILADIRHNTCCSADCCSFTPSPASPSPPASSSSSSKGSSAGVGIAAANGVAFILALVAYFYRRKVETQNTLGGNKAEPLLPNGHHQ
jgi:hypothetical protein